MDNLHHFANARNQQQLKERLNSLEERLRQQDSKQAKQEEWQKLLYNQSLQIEENISALTTETDIGKLEQISAEVAYFYETNHAEVVRLVDPDNYSALEYKELASKCRERLQTLRTLEWYEWGKRKSQNEVTEYFNQSLLERRRKYEESEARNKKESRLTFVCMVLASLFLAVVTNSCW